MNEPTKEAIEPIEAAKLPEQEEPNTQAQASTRSPDVPEQDEQKVNEQNTASDETASTTEATPKTDNSDEEAKALEAKYYALSHDVDESKLDDVLKIAKTKVSDKITMEQAIDMTLERFPVLKKERFGVEITTAGSTNNEGTLESFDNFTTGFSLGQVSKYN